VEIETICIYAINELRKYLMTLISNT